MLLATHKSSQYHTNNSNTTDVIKSSIMYQTCSSEGAKIFGIKKEVGTVLENHFRGISCSLEEEMRTLDGGEETEKSWVSC